MNKLIEKLNKIEEKIENTIFDLSLNTRDNGWCISGLDEQEEEIWSTASSSLKEAISDIDEDVKGLYIWKMARTPRGGERAIEVMVSISKGSVKAKITNEQNRTVKSII